MCRYRRCSWCGGAWSRLADRANDPRQGAGRQCQGGGQCHTWRERSLRLTWLALLPLLLLLPPLLLLLILVQAMLRHLLLLQPLPLPKLPWLLLAPDRRLSVLAWLRLVILTPSRPQLQPRLQLLHRPLQLVSVAGQRPPMLESERLLLLLLRQLLPPLLPPA